ncbi:hypothetical protein AXI76_gp049 [Pseudoalteromonas phage H101]|uniref:Uncharacterized protein n=1 Tax=Pseudoalteromonas phage H101 TaxID=1654919 RepID=A0A0H4J219_9CAUD|nr:hypothetical protein AXI76_gp049 [Pseudoalteromonas phage H101]AKO60950.1 hypothetical protein [Pseudoalteromonas phage H101]
MISPAQFQQALDTNRQIIECIFQQEASFKDYLVNELHYFRLKYPETYELERVHVSRHRFRITVIFEDMGELDLYIDAQDVYCWYAQEYKRLRGV